MYDDHPGKRILRALEELKDGWAGPGSIAPPAPIRSAVEAFCRRLDIDQLENEIEVDPDDGSTTLRFSHHEGNDVLVFAFLDGVSWAMRLERDGSVMKASSRLHLDGEFSSTSGYDRRDPSIWVAAIARSATSTDDGGDSA